MKPDDADTDQGPQERTDVLTPEQRRLVMSQIRGKDTKPEMLVRRGLHAEGFRYRLHPKDVPGKPDMVLPKFRTVIFVHGCFWHGHNCSLFKWPKTRAEFWEKKIQGNIQRDTTTIEKLKSEGWKVLVVWECALRGKRKKALAAVIEESSRFICNKSISVLNIKGI